MTDRKPYRHRFPISIIQHAVWLYHRFPLSFLARTAPTLAQNAHPYGGWALTMLGRYRDVQELLQARGIEVSHDTLREWYMDEVCTTIGGVRHWLFLARAALMKTLGRWRAVDEHGIVLDVLLQRHRDTEAARTFLARLLGEFHVPATICTDKLASYGAAIRELPALQEVDHQQVIRAARCNNLVEQRASVATLRCRDGKINLDRGGAVPDDLHLCGAVLPKTVALSHTTTRAWSTRFQETQANPGIPQSPRPDDQPSAPHPNDGSRPYQKKRAGVLKGVRSAQEATNTGHVRCGARSAQRWLEVQATPALRQPATRLT